MYANGNPIRYNDPTGHDVGCSAGDLACADSNGLTPAARWEMAAVTIPTKVEKAYADAGKLNPVTEKLLSDKSPAAGLLYFGWASNELVHNIGNGGAAVSSAVLDLGIVTASNAATGFMGLTAGDDVGESPIAEPSIDSVEPIVSSRPGMNGNPDHINTVDELSAMAANDFKGKNVTIKYNSSIKDALGIDRRPDVSVWDNDTGQLCKVYEAARTDSNGNFVPREQQKMFEYFEMGVSNFFGKVGN